MFLTKKEKPNLNLRGIVQQLLAVGIEPLIKMITEAIVEVVVYGVTAGIKEAGLLEKLGALADSQGQEGEVTSAKQRGRPRRGPAFCSVEGCGSKVMAKGFCSKHYQSSKRDSQKGNGTVELQKAKRVLLVDPKKVCSVAGCPRRSRAKGMCSKHYQTHHYQQKRRQKAIASV